MPVLYFNSEDGTFCQIELSDAKLPKVITNQMHLCKEVWSNVTGLKFNQQYSDITDLSKQPLFFEWQQLNFLFECENNELFPAPYALYINDVLEPSIRCKKFGDKYRLMGFTKLGNAVGRTKFSIRDSRNKTVFELGAEVFPEKLDYKDDFSAMLDEITEIIYSLAFDVFKKTYASTKVHTTYHQTLSEWLNLYKVLATSFEQSIDTILRIPKSEIKRSLEVKPIDLVRKVSRKSLVSALKKPDRYCRGGGLSLTNGIKISHLQEQKREVSYDTQENRFVVWAIKDVIKTLTFLISQVGSKRESKRLDIEIQLLKLHQRKLRHRLQAPVFSSVANFNNQQQFSTTLTMAPGYKEFYHRYLLLRKGLTLADNAIFNMDYKDIATLYEYWCFLKTVKLLRDNPKYDLTGNDIIKIEHHRFNVTLKKDEESAVHFRQRSSNDEISLYFNRTFERDKHTYTFDQRPDNFIEFSRAGYGNGSNKDKKKFKVVLDAKYRFERGQSQDNKKKNPYGPPVDTIAQLHRYRDALLWEEDFDDSVRIANKSIGGVILFPYPNPEEEFKSHPYYQSIDKVNIGAVPLQPGHNRQNALYQKYLESLFEQSGESIYERRVHFDTREYDTKKQAQSDLVMVGMVPAQNRDGRRKYHATAKVYYTEWAKNPTFPLEKAKIIALYDQVDKKIYATAKVLKVEFLLGKELKETGTTWPLSHEDKKYCVYHLDELTEVELYAGLQMQGHRQGRFFVSNLGLQLALEHNNAELLFINAWEKYKEWKTLCTQSSKVSIKRKTQSSNAGKDISELEFIPESSE